MADMQDAQIIDVFLSGEHYILILDNVISVL